MRVPTIVLLAALSAIVPARVWALNTINEVITYTPGAGVSGGFTTPSSIIGAPTVSIPGPFGGPVTPFNPPYLGSQIVSVGAGGSISLQFESPVQNFSGSPYGLDFMVFGNAGFIITNATDENFNYIGEPRTDGSLFGGNNGTSRVWVSSDNISYYLLNPALAPTVDLLYPTDGAGNLTMPVNPGLIPGHFGGRDLDEIRALYGGSGGGAGFDLSWAQDAGGQPVALDTIRYVRIDVLSGKADLDALVAVPEPSTILMVCIGGLFCLISIWRRTQA